MLREVTSKDQKLLETFKKINEFNVVKMAENPQFVLGGSRGAQPDEDKAKEAEAGRFDNIDLRPLSPSSEPPPPPAKPQVSKLKQRRPTLFVSKPPSLSTQYRDLLDNAMYTPKRRVRLRL